MKTHINSYPPQKMSLEIDDFCNFCLGGPCSLNLGLKISSVVFQLPVIQPGHSGHFSPVATESGSCANLFFLLVLSREWMGMGEWDDYY